MNLLIEAKNIRAGGGVTHLVELLSALDRIERWPGAVALRAGGETLGKIGNFSWLEKIPAGQSWTAGIGGFSELEIGILRKKRMRPDIVLVPGGTYLGSFKPFVVLAQNLLPFDRVERRREGYSLKRLRLLILERLQGYTFRRASGVIYMSEISRNQIERCVGFRPKRGRVVHHGTGAQFFRRGPLVPGVSSIGSASAHKELRLLYVSILEPYKHQIQVVTAVAEARARGLLVSLDIAGPAAPGEANRLSQACAKLNLGQDVVRYYGAIPYHRLEDIYSKADAFIFASSCETFGIILLEAMAAGLPLLCSSRSSLPEVAGEAALYFDPLDVSSITRALTTLYDDKKLRESLAFRSRRRASQFSWERCARETFGFVREVYAAHQATKGA